MLLMAAILLTVYFHKPMVQQKPLEQAGVVNIGKVLKAHPRYHDLLQLYGEKADLAFRLKSLSKNTAEQILPEDNTEAFHGFAQQKNDMTVNLLNGKLSNEMIDKEKDLRAQIAADKRAEIKKQSDKYENAIFNCSLKLDNADNMRLTPDEIEALQQEMTRLKQERAAKIKAVLAKYESYVQAQLGQYYNDRLHDFQSMASQKAAENTAEADKEQAEFSAQKNDMAAQQANKTEQRKNYFALLKEYADKNQEIRQLHQSMLDDISVKASMFAVRYHLSIIYAADDDNNELLSDDDDWSRFFDEQVVVTDGVRDITADVIEQMQDAD